MKKTGENGVREVGCALALAVVQRARKSFGSRGLKRWKQMQPSFDSTFFLRFCGALQGFSETFCDEEYEESKVFQIA